VHFRRRQVSQRLPADVVWCPDRVSVDNGKFFRVAGSGTGGKIIGPIYLAANDSSAVMNISWAGQHITAEILREPDNASDWAVEFECVLATPTKAPDRISQRPDVLALQLGVLCSDGAPGGADTEECHHARFTADVINDKTDGLFDDLLPFATIKVVDTSIGCVDVDRSRPLNGLRTIMDALPDLTGIVGPGCSDDVAALTSSGSRSTSGNTAVHFSQSSTAPILADHGNYPNLIRLTTNEYGVQAAVVAISQHFRWKRVGVVNDDSTWGQGASSVFIERFVAEQAHEVLNPAVTDRQLTKSQIERGESYADRIISRVFDKLEAAGARIIWIAANPSVQRAVFSYVYRHKRMFGKGHAWITAWLSEGALVGADGLVDSNAVKGAEGLIGVGEGVDLSPENTLIRQYSEAWGKASSVAACNGGATAERPYCDSDGDPSTLPGYRAFMADAVLTYAKGMHAIYQDDPTDSAALHAAVLALPAFAGVSGTVSLDPKTGDRLGLIKMKNLQLLHGTVRARRYVALESTKADFVDVGQYSSADGVRMLAGSPIIFPGGVQDVPLDAVAEPETSTETSPGLIFVYVFIPMLVLLGGVYWRHVKHQAGHIRKQKKRVEEERREKARAQQEADLERSQKEVARKLQLVAEAEQKEERKARVAAEKKLDDFQKSMSSMFQVSKRWLGMDLGRYSGPQSILDHDADSEEEPAGFDDVDDPWNTASTVETEFGMPRRERIFWYWREDKERLSAHNPMMIMAPCWVQYANSVSIEMERQYQIFLKDPSKHSHRTDLTDRISTTGTEKKAFAQDTGVKYVINFRDLTQKNVASGYERQIHRHSKPEPSTRERNASFGNQLRRETRQLPYRSDTDASKASVELVDPLNEEELEDALPLTAGQLVQVQERRGEVWYGSIIFAEGEHLQKTVNKSGWFPRSFVSEASPALTAKFHASLGGGSASHALESPSHWAQQDTSASTHAATFDIPIQGQEGQKLIQQFKRTMSSRGQVQRITRIQNIALWQSYAVKRITVMQRAKHGQNPSRFERVYLFHGTDKVTAEKILQQGFNRNFAGAHAVAYGRGVYFARDAAYSSHPTYASRDSNGVQRMFMCRVVVGEYCLGTNGAKVPDVLDPATNRLYDTTVDNTSNPSIYVTYHDAQCYPEYLLEFTS
jgi:hypothetical protein